MRPPVITLTTDFGTADFYVGAVKGTILSIAPAAVLVDLSHQVPPRDVRAASRLLRGAAGEFPPDTVHLAVVDPGVGGDRRPVAARGLGHYWVGPDNGLFTHVMADGQSRMRQLCHPGITRPVVGNTFHGRDLFAPAAAHLASAFPFAQVGPEVTDPVLLEQAPARRTEAGVVGQVEHVDVFGNLITSIPRDLVVDLDLDGPLLIRVGGEAIAANLAATYCEVPAGEPVALIGSTGALEISICCDSAADALGVGPGAAVTIEPA